MRRRHGTFPTFPDLQIPLTALEMNADSPLPPFAQRAMPQAVEPSPVNTPVGHARASRVEGSLSCVVPCYNEAANLASLLPMLRDALASLTPRWEVVLVDDGSTDASAVLLVRWAQEPGFRVVLLSRNFGKEAALSAGLEAARGDAVLLMDADLQHPPAILGTFVQHWRDGADVVYAVRESREGESLFKRWGTRLFYRLVNARGRFKVPPDASDFRLMDRAVVNAILTLPERSRFMRGLYAWVGFDAVAVPYVPDARLYGSTHYTVRGLIRLSLDALTAFTTLPLRAVSAVGFSMAMFAFGYGTYLTVRHLFAGDTVSGWTALAVSLLGLSGIQLLSLCVVGEYVGHIYDEVKARPLYVVKRELGRGLPPRDAP